MKDSKLKDKIKKLIFSNLSKIQNVKSITITGSFNQNNRIREISDIDTIVIVDKLNKNIFEKCLNSIKKINLTKIFNEDFNLIINSSFGPLKFNDHEKNLIIHIMIYDVAGHIKHCLNSPFTCYDWERSNTYTGLKLDKIFGIKRLNLNDFLNSRRSIKGYLNDLKINRISYRKYIFKNNNYIERKFYKKLSDNEKIEFYYHIMKFLIINFYKFHIGENKIPSTKKFKQIFLTITKNMDLYLYFRQLENYKRHKSKIKPIIKTKLINQFVEIFSNYINLIDKKNIKIIFIRHFKTNLNDGTFLGQGRDPEIYKNIKNNLIKNKFKYLFSSPYKRALQTANLYKKKYNNVYIDKLLSEINYGRFEGMTFLDLKKDYLDFVKKWDKGIDIKFPDGENTHQVYSRVKQFCDQLIRKIIKKEIKDKILVVSHNVFLRCLIGSFYRIEKKYWHLLKINHNEQLNFIMYEKKLVPDLNRALQYNILRNFYD